MVIVVVVKIFLQRETILKISQSMKLLSSFCDFKFLSFVFLSFCISIDFLRRNPSDEMSEDSQVSKVTLCV